MLNKKGFTLIELLAVLIILAAIVLITVPSIGKILQKSRDSSFDDTINSIEKAANLYASSLEIDEDVSFPIKITFEDGKAYYKYGDESKVSGNLLSLKGKIPDNGIVTIYEDKSVDYAIYNDRKKVCVKKDNTNLLNVTNSNISVTNFNGGTNKTVSVGKLDMRSLETDDVMQLDFDVVYTEVSSDYDSGEGVFKLQGSGNVTAWSPGIAFNTIKLNGTGVYHYTGSKKVTSSNKQNTSFNMNFRFDYISSGKIEISNVKVIKQNSTLETDGKCI